MKKKVKKISLSREVLRDFDVKQAVGGNDDGGPEPALTSENCGVVITG